MVKQQKKNNRKKWSSKDFTANNANARKINASTKYETCNQQGGRKGHNRKPPFGSKSWYRPWKHKDIVSNSCICYPKHYSISTGQVSSPLFSKFRLLLSAIHVTN